MKVNFYTFDKRANSTKQPTGTGTEVTCVLKDNVSEHDPVLLLKGHNFSYNYAYIQEFGRYYFVRDIVSVANNLTEYHLAEDPLATYKSEIGDTWAHVVFSSSNYDTFAVDPRIVVANTRTTHKSGGSTNTYKVFPSSGGWYILSVFNDRYAVGGGSAGVACSYALDDDAMSMIRRWLGSASVIQAIDSYLGGDPLKSIFNCIWVPYDLSSVGVDSASVVIAGQTNPDNLTGHCRWIYEFSQETHTIQVPCHLRYIDFRAAEPYTTGNIYLPGIGVVNLNMGDWLESTNINVEYTIEHLTGNVRYYLKTDNGDIIQTLDCCVASQCPFGQTTVNGAAIVGSIMGVGSGAAMLAAGIAAGPAGAGMISGGALSLISGVTNTVLAANRRDTSVVGNIGGRLVQTQPYIQHTEFSADTEDPDDVNYIAERGRPFMGMTKISGVSGFVQCENASVSCAGTALEKQEINNFLNSGFYYE